MTFYVDCGIIGASCLVLLLTILTNLKNMQLHEGEKVEAYIFDMKTARKINPTDLFGNEGMKFLEACKNISDNDAMWERMEQTIYRSPSRPSIHDVKERNPDVKEDDLLNLYLKAKNEWEKCNIEEVVKENVSWNKLAEFKDEQFRIIYEIAERHGLKVHWHGYDELEKFYTTSDTTKWSIYKNNKLFARVHVV